MVRITKITEDNFEISVCDSLKGIMNREEVLDLFWYLADKLNYEVRDKWS